MRPVLLLAAGLMLALVPAADAEPAAQARLGPTVCTSYTQPSLCTGLVCVDPDGNGDVRPGRATCVGQA